MAVWRANVRVRCAKRRHRWSRGLTSRYCDIGPGQRVRQKNATRAVRWPALRRGRVVWFQRAAAHLARAARIWTARSAPHGRRDCVEVDRATHGCRPCDRCLSNEQDDLTGGKPARPYWARTSCPRLRRSNCELAVPSPTISRLDSSLATCLRSRARSLRRSGQRDRGRSGLMTCTCGAVINRSVDDD